MTSPIIRPTPSTRPALDLIALAKLSPEVARRNLRALLARNPDHFGKLPGIAFTTVLKIEKDTTYERIAGVGYNLESERIQCIVTIRQQTGYSGDERNPASDEYVRFYVSYDGGATWHDQGMRAFSVRDESESRPRQQAVTLRIRPRAELCSPNIVPRIRAILSWNASPPPCDPHWTPVWGDVAEAEVCLNKTEFIPEETLFHASDVDPRHGFADPRHTIETTAPRFLDPAELRNLYRPGTVPEHRYLSALLSNMRSASSQQNLRASDWEDLRSTSLFDGISDIDLAALIPAWLNTVEDTRYEQLDCVGFDASSCDLVAVVNIKTRAGYCGGAHTFGSTEFVAFWIDCGERWEHVGTAAIHVHDMSQIPACGFRHSVFLPLESSMLARLAAAGIRAAKVRAVLSWNTPPSTESVYEPVVWGNTVDALVALPQNLAINAIPPAEVAPVFTAVGQ